MCQQSQHKCAQVTIDVRALIDKVLARYSGEFTVFRELLQNSDDAGCDSAEIRFETAAFARRDPEAARNTGAPILPNLAATNVAQWTFRNHGKPFTPEDWTRLPRIALGNPDPWKVGAFGVGFYSLFSITENPHVSSGDKEMQFFWDDENQLHYRFGNLPQTRTKDLWTTFQIPLREAAPMPPLSEFMQFLASSITFMAHLRDVTVFLDHHRVGQVNKSVGQSQVTPIPPELERSSPKEIMMVKSVQQYPITIKVGVRHHKSKPMYETREDLAVFTAEVDVTVDQKLSKELNRCTKKDPPSRLKYSLIYTGKDEYDQSRINERNHPRGFPSPFQRLRVDLDGSQHTRVFIGHATAQTTGVGGHMASSFIPTVERESIDLVDINVAIWNRELLYVGGFLCRVVYEFELSRIQSIWQEAAAGEPHSHLSGQLQNRLHERFLHALRFFTFHHSTPLPKVAELLSDSFYGCSTLSLRVLSSVGVREAPDVRMFDGLLAKFLKSLPMLSKYVTEHGAQSIAKLPKQHKIPSITVEEVLQGLRRCTLDVEELVACLGWWITSRRAGLASNTADLLDAVTLRSTSGETYLSSITCFIDPKVLGHHIPPDGPLPPSLISLSISKRFNSQELGSFGWKEFTAASWLHHISHADVLSADKKYDLTQSVEWASRVLSTLYSIWPRLSEDIRSESRKVLSDKPCIPTSKGLCCPQYSYLAVADNALFHHLDLPIVSPNSRFKVDGDMKGLLTFIGVRTHPPVQLLLQMLATGDGTISDLLDYLVQQQSSLTFEELSAVKSSTIFLQEGFQGQEEVIRYRADQLYPPVNIFRRLRLPVIKWSGKSEWGDTLPEARLLYSLGLNHSPPLSTVMDLCSSRVVEVQETAFGYLCENLHSQYRDYKPENFRHVDFIPAESKRGTSLKRLEEVYSSTQWKALNFPVVRDRFLSAPLDRLGVAQHPLTSKLLDLLEMTPPPDRATAADWFEILFDHISSFAPLDRIRLSGLPIVPTGLTTPSLLPPTRCYLDRVGKPALYAKLFVFVNFGTKANRFLEACGLKDKVPIEDVAEALIQDPKAFFKHAGGYEGFLIELRKLANQRQDISNDTRHKMSHTHSLLGVCRKKAAGSAGFDYDYQFLTSQEVTIVDDIDDYQLFSDVLFVAPQEEALERFYASLGCSYLSALVKVRCHDLHEIPSVKTCAKVRSLILERLPLFIKTYPDIKLKVTVPSGPDRLKIKACKKIRVSKTLATASVEKMKDVGAIAKREGDSVELWIAKYDMYEISKSLCRLLFGTNKVNDTLLLESILSRNLEVLKQRGLLVDQSSQKLDTTASPALTTNSPQQPLLDNQPDHQLHRETPQKGSETTPQVLSHRHPVDSVLLNDRKASNEPSDPVTDSISLPLSRTCHEMISQTDIRKNVEGAINACGLGGEKSDIYAGVSEFLSSGFCRLSADVRSLCCIGQVRNIQVCVDEGMRDADTFMECKRDPISRFVDIIISLSKIYGIPAKTLRIFGDISGGCIAFNCQGTIYLNLRYFEAWHYEQVKSGNRQNAQMFWFLTLAHEIAHNETPLHDANHEFWFLVICEARLVGLSKLLQPTNGRLRYALWLGLALMVILPAYFARYIALATNVSR